MRPRDSLRYGGLWAKVIKPLLPEEAKSNLPSKEALSYNAILNTVKSRGAYKMVPKGGKRYFDELLRLEVERLYDSWKRMKGELNFTVEEALKYVLDIVEQAWQKTFPNGAETPAISGEKYAYATKELEGKFYRIRGDLADELNISAKRLGKKVKDMVNEAVEHEIAISRLGLSSRQVMEFYQAIKLCSNYGLYLTPVEPLNQSLERLKIKDFEAIEKSYLESGTMIGSYLRTSDEDEYLRLLKRIFDTGIFGVTSLTLFKREKSLEVKCVAPTLTVKGTKLLVKFLEGIMKGLNFKLAKRDLMKGIIHLTISTT